MYKVLKYSKTWWENDDISIYRYRTGPGNKFNLIMRMTVYTCVKFSFWLDLHGLLILKFQQNIYIIFCYFVLIFKSDGIFMEWKQLKHISLSYNELWSVETAATHAMLFCDFCFTPCLHIMFLYFRHGVYRHVNIIKW